LLGKIQEKRVNNVTHRQKVRYNCIFSHTGKEA
jgi:hypothetical protein